MKVNLNCNEIYKFPITHSIQCLRENYEKLESRDVSVAGRVHTIRDHGKVCFVDIYSGGYKIQVFIEKNGEKKRVDRINVGDYIGVKGKLGKTKTGEKTIFTEELVRLAKTQYKMPDKYYGIRKPGIKRRDREKYFISDPEAVKNIKLRYEFIGNIRKFLNGKGFIEVETPILQAQYGGAFARPFETYCHALDKNFYLRISPELYLKRLIIAGFEKVYEIGKNFRNEGIDKTHVPEFTMMEVYAACWDYEDMMDLLEEMIKYASNSIGITSIRHENTEIDITQQPWKRISMCDAFRECGIDINNMNKQDLIKILSENNIETNINTPKGMLIEEVFGIIVQPHLLQPTIIYDYPRETTPLARTHRSNPKLVERFEFYICGIEIANAYSELNDANEQKKRFEEQEKLRKTLGSDVTHPYDNEYIEALKHGMPPTGGLGVGIDRIVMLLLGSNDIRDIIPFPLS